MREIKLQQIRPYTPKIIAKQEIGVYVYGGSNVNPLPVPETVVRRDEFGDIIVNEYSGNENAAISYKTVKSLIDEQSSKLRVYGGHKYAAEFTNDLLTKEHINMFWTLRDVLTTTDLFVEGSGRNLLPGTDIAVAYAEDTKTYKFDILGNSNVEYKIVDVITNQDNGFNILYASGAELTLPIKGKEGLIVDVDETNECIEIHLEDTFLQNVNRAARALVTPVQKPISFELVGIDTTNDQARVKLGDGLQYENGVLKSVSALKIVSTNLIGQDENGGNIYEQVFDNGTTQRFTAPKGNDAEIKILRLL